MGNRVMSTNYKFEFNGKKFGLFLIKMKVPVSKEQQENITESLDYLLPIPVVKTEDADALGIPISESYYIKEGYTAALTEEENAQWLTTVFKNIIDKEGNIEHTQLQNPKRIAELLDISVPETRTKGILNPTNIEAAPAPEKKDPTQQPILKQFQRLEPVPDSPELQAQKMQSKMTKEKEEALEKAASDKWRANSDRIDQATMAKLKAEKARRDSQAQRKGKRQLELDHIIYNKMLMLIEQAFKKSK